MSSDVSQHEHHETFCKKTFPMLFNHPSRDTKPRATERAELADIDQRAKDYRALTHWNPPVTAEEQQRTLDRAYQAGVLFNIQRNKVAAQAEWRNEFYACFAPYSESEQAEEFLPFFLDQFVQAAYHQKIPALQTWVERCIRVGSGHAEESYRTKLLDMMWASLPEKIVENFIRSDFRAALERYCVYAHSLVKSKERIALEDNVCYAASLSEPHRYY